MSRANRQRQAPREVSAQTARRVILRLQELGQERQRSSNRRVAELVQKLGYVQIDSINVVERAHHLILGARLEGYRPEHLSHALEQSRLLFEHWTHDACAIPAAWYPHWHGRFRSFKERANRSAWWRSHFADGDERVLQRVLGRVRRDGELSARVLTNLRDGESDAKGGRLPRGRVTAQQQASDEVGKGWWNWHPEKAALEHLWRTGKLAVARRDRFEKVYDLTERVLGMHHQRPKPSPAQHVDWACREALARMGVATPAELSRFFSSVSIASARDWCRQAVRQGDACEVVLQTEITKPVVAFAIPKLAQVAAWEPVQSMIILAPFDPVVRDRSRLLRVFGFHYRFEAFTIKAKRKYGYYTMPILRGDRFVGLIDPKFDRENGELLVRGPWWTGATGRAARRLDDELAPALARLAAQVGASQWRFVP